MTPINHHFVAQHVLRRFCDPQGVLWTYDKRLKRIGRGRPRSAACRQHFYSFERNTGVDNETIELGFLSKIDNDGSVAIARLLRREYLTTKQAADFMRFAAAQMLRVEAHFQRIEAVFSPMFQEMAERMVKHHQQFRTELTQDFRETCASEGEIEKLMATLEAGKFTMTASRDFIVTTFLTALDQATALFCQMNWSFLRIEGTSEVFVISDNPLVLTDVGDGDEKPLGIANPDIEITMPLNPTTVAVGRWTGKTGYGTVGHVSIPVINERTIERATRFVYAPYRSSELLDRVVASEGRQAKSRIQRIQRGNSLVILHTYSSEGIAQPWLSQHSVGSAQS